jgi:2-keto-4-pentenoate hydratase/2-oxohepta-3-ene-1,7-dioic acid hydratase in catechol pathway
LNKKSNGALTPLSLSVTVKIGDRFTWKGHISEYIANPDRVVDFFKTIFPLVPGIVLGMGTIPDCTGLDNDCWINPVERITITFDGLGTLRQLVPRVPADLEASRWKKRPELITS